MTGPVFVDTTRLCNERLCNEYGTTTVRTLSRRDHRAMDRVTDRLGQAADGMFL